MKTLEKTIEWAKMIGKVAVATVGTEYLCGETIEALANMKEYDSIPLAAGLFYIGYVATLLTWPKKNFIKLNELYKEDRS